jgi:hypothetical protein
MQDHTTLVRTIYVNLPRRFLSAPFFSDFSEIFFGLKLPDHRVVLPAFYEPTRMGGGRGFLTSIEQLPAEPLFLGSCRGVDVFHQFCRHLLFCGEGERLATNADNIATTELLDSGFSHIFANGHRRWLLAIDTRKITFVHFKIF